MNQIFSADMIFGKKMLYLAFLIIIMYAIMMIQIIIHEAGHLVFGLLSGYQFTSFRIMSFMLVKESGKMKIRRLNLAGTGGQCLMAPPEMVNGEIPVVLYNLGGSIMNVIISIVLLGMYFLFLGNPFLETLLLMSVVIGIAFAIMNGVPMRMGTVDNDGYNAWSLRKDKEALRSFWIQMKVSEQIAKGVRLREMPEEWFALPDEEKMKNSMIAVEGVFSCNYLMDKHCFEEASHRMKHLLKIESGIVGIHRCLMICDLIYCELISDNRKDVLDQMMTKEQLKFMKSMKEFPSVIRTEYAYSLLVEKDHAEAERIKARFEKCARTYPYPSDINAERELMEIAENEIK